MKNRILLYSLSKHNMTVSKQYLHTKMIHVSISVQIEYIPCKMGKYALSHLRILLI